MSEILRAVLRDLTADPARSIAEVVQGLLLIAGLWWFGRGYVAKRLETRARRIAADLDAAEAAERDVVRLREEAVTVVEQARSAGPELIRAATERAATARSAAVASIEEEARQIILQAHKTVDADKEHLRREASDRLVRLTTEAARLYLDEVLSEDERRTLTRKAILQFLDDLAPAPAPEHSGVG